MNNKNIRIGMKSAVLILVLAAAAAGITGLLVSQSRDAVQEVLVQEPMVENLAESTQSTQPAAEPVISTSPSMSATTPAPAAVPTQPAPVILPQPTEAPVRQTLATASPVPGDTIAEYAMDCLSYNATTRDWRIHNGIDLAAEEGTPVCAAAAGTVYTTYEDDTLGYTVVLRHDGGYTTRYSSLREDLRVKPGDTVTLGQPLGYASDTALTEAVMGAHVHFSVSCQDVPMDPNDFLNLS